MDTFMDKLAQKLNAQEMIKANSAADADVCRRLCRLDGRRSEGHAHPAAVQDRTQRDPLCAQSAYCDHGQMRRQGSG